MRRQPGEITLSEAVALSGLSERTIRRRVKCGRLAARKSGRHLMLQRDAVADPTIHAQLEMHGDKPVDNIAHPPHYAATAIEPIDVIETWGLGYRLGNVVKYVARAGRKGDATDDLRKARWYLDREIAATERQV